MGGEVLVVGWGGGGTEASAVQINLLIVGFLGSSGGVFVM